MDQFSQAIANLRHSVNQSLDKPWQHCVDQVLTGEQLDEFSHPAIVMLQKGKRLRAIGAATGWVLAGNEIPLQWPKYVIDLGVCLELYQASALVHDDIIDEALTRRSYPTAHVAFSASFPTYGPHFGISAAILWGNLLTAASQSYFSQAVHAQIPQVRADICGVYNTMQAEVAYGQFLDLESEFRELGNAAPPSVEDARSVITHKSARYSVVQPLQMGALLGGKDMAFADRLALAATPLGIAYQLRDDELGIFGNPELTGKPSGDDIRSGKRTVHLAMAWEMTDDAGRDYIMRYWGAPDVNDAVVDNLRTIVQGSGARARVETIIAQKLDSSQEALSQLSLPDHAQQLWQLFANSLIDRVS